MKSNYLFIYMHKNILLLVIITQGGYEQEKTCSLTSFTHDLLAAIL